MRTSTADIHTSIAPQQNPLVSSLTIQNDGRSARAICPADPMPWSKWPYNHALSSDLDENYSAAQRHHRNAHFRRSMASRGVPLLYICSNGVIVAAEASVVCRPGVGRYVDTTQAVTSINSPSSRCLSSSSTHRRRHYSPACSSHYHIHPCLRTWLESSRSHFFASDFFPSLPLAASY